MNGPIGYAEEEEEKKKRDFKKHFQIFYSFETDRKHALRDAIRGTYREKQFVAACNQEFAGRKS